MFNIQGYISLISDNNYKLPEFIGKWQQVYYGMSLHIDGVKPCYQTLRDPSLGWVENNMGRIYPNRYGGVHYQYIFENELFSRHPKEPEIIRQWRLGQYKPLTQAPFLNAIHVVTGAIFQDSGYELSIQNKDDNDYIWGENFDGRTLVGYISAKFQNIASDPNGIFITIPSEPYYETTTKKIEPEVHFICSRDIRYYNEDEIVFLKEDTYWAVNEMGYFRFRKDQSNNWYHVDEEYGGYYAHNLDELPIVYAGGQWNNQGFYDSWLQAAKPIADEFVSAKSAEQLVNKENSHPWIVTTPDDCPDCEGNGKIRYCTTCQSIAENCSCETSNPTLTSCNNCNGTGNISRNPGQWQVVPYDQMDRDTLKLINPDTSINKFHAENNKAMETSILRALHLDYIEVAQSGKAKDKDMETRYQFILGISNDLFDRVIYTLCKHITALRNVTANGGNVEPKVGEIIIVKPTQFQIKTAHDLVTDYELATKAEMPDYVRTSQVESYVDKMYGGDDILKRKVSLINQMDMFALTSMPDISVALINGIDHRNLQFHLHLPMIIDSIVRDKMPEWFLNATYDQIKVEVDARFDVLAPPVLPIQADIVRNNINI